MKRCGTSCRGGIFLGGAPLNVAYHLSRLGVRAVPVSAVGRDFLGDEALGRMTAQPVRTAHQIETAARGFAATHGLNRICVTAGGRGAGLLWSDRWAWEEGRPVTVRDTIGAGDAFLAAFLAAHFVRAESPREALASACRLGEFVAMRDGATPPYRCNARGRPRKT